MPGRGQRIAHFDPTTGAAGDMILAALIDAGADLSRIRGQLESLSLPAFRIDAPETKHRGFRARQLQIEVPEEKEHRGLREIEGLLGGGGLSERARGDALRVFRRLAEAEARTHGVALEEIHFHEVGALDSIIDIAGTAVALDLLDIDRVTFSPLHLGTGEVRAAHGVLPVPVPAVLELVQGFPVVRTDIRGEILTPTGAAILTALGQPDPGEAFVLERTGTACGTRELPGRPNLLRVSLGRESLAAERDGSGTWESDEVLVLETNLDDMSAEVLPTVVEELMGEGALDAFLTSTLMKKGRPGHLLTVLVEPERAERIAHVLFRETSTFGVRLHRCPRWKLPRESREIPSPWGPVRVKVGSLGGGQLRVTPEHESCRAIADRTGRPLIQVYKDIEELIRSSEWISEGEER